MTPLFRLVWNVLLVVARGLEWLVLWPLVLLRLRRRRFVKLELGGAFRLAPRPGMPSWLARDHSYAALAERLRQIARDRHVEGVVLKLSSPTISFADAALVRQRLLRLRAAGKRVVCYLEGSGAKGLTLTAAADTVMMAPGGTLMVPGLAFELTFLRDALHRIGLRAQFVHIGRYKTAGHLFTRRRSSRAQHGMMRGLLDDLGATIGERMVRANAAGGRWPTWDHGALLSVPKARRAGLIDHQAFPDQVGGRLRAERGPEDFDPYGTFGDEALARELKRTLDSLPAVTLQSASSHGRQRPRPLRLVRLFGSRPELHVVEMSGLITTDDAVGGPLGGRAHINPGNVRRVFKSLRQNRRVKAVVLAIDSRGGSALASDLIWREVRRLRHEKPVVAVMREVAASGGYYIAVGADEILADESTLTGSIGVVAGKIAVSGVLEKAAVRGETLTLGEHATLLSPRHAWSESEIAAMRTEIRDAYRRFVNKVAVGRGMKAMKVHLLARGQVYTGRQALKRGLIDGLGTVDDALVRAAERAGLPLERLAVRWRSLAKPTLRALLTGSMARADGPARWLEAAEPAILDALELAALLRADPVLTVFEGRLSA